MTWGCLMELDILGKNLKKTNVTREEAEALTFVKTLLGMMMMPLSSYCLKNGGSWREVW